MSPLRGEEFTGRSVEEAIERGLRSLGKKRTEVEYEVLEKGKPANVLGIGGEDARVLITFVEEDAPPTSRSTSRAIASGGRSSSARSLAASLRGSARAARL